NTRRSHFFSEASRELGSSLDAEATGSRLLEMLVPRFASEATLALCNAGGGLDFVLDCEPAPRGKARVRRRAVDALQPADLGLLLGVVESRQPTQADDASPFTLLPLLNADRLVGAIRLRPTQ